MQFEEFIGRGGSTVQLEELLENIGAVELKTIDLFELMLPNRLMVFISQQINHFALQKEREGNSFQRCWC